MTERCIDCGRAQQEFHPDFPDLRDWFYGHPGKQRCGDCAIATDVEGKPLAVINEERRLIEEERDETA